MKFIIDTNDLEVSKSMIEILLENELAIPVTVKEVNHIDEEELDELAMIKYPCNCSLNETYCDCCINPDLKEAYKAGYRKALENDIRRI